jgi:hypothetical protein
VAKTTSGVNGVPSKDLHRGGVDMVPPPPSSLSQDLSRHLLSFLSIDCFLLDLFGIN